MLITFLKTFLMREREMSKTIAYIRVSTEDQDYRNQKFEIFNYCDQKGWQEDKCLELAISSSRSAKERQIGLPIEFGQKTTILN